MLLDELDLDEEEGEDEEAERKREARARLRMEAEVDLFLRILSWTPNAAAYFPSVTFPVGSVLTVIHTSWPTMQNSDALTSDLKAMVHRITHRRYSLGSCCRVCTVYA